ncbi:unnamed protein product [Adineta steineri]|uniref:Uncharacterized protein n=1 Tax=Adineta steineri TaxID=433720 RepID=A0A813M732_9BILA|nr:unnamed protein product [Adineta steineri]CAF4022142.1 unnamed protein product [Adineta steineri]
MDIDEQQHLKSTNEIVKFVLNSNSSSLTTTNSNPIQVEIQMPIHVQKVYMYEAETQTSLSSSSSSNEQSDLLSKEAGDEARLTGSTKHGLLSLDEYQIIRTGEEHCLKKYFSDDDISLSDDDEEITVEKQMEQMTLDQQKDRTTVLIENLNNNASTNLSTSHSNLSNTFLLDDTTHLSATLAQSTSSHISHSRYLQTFEKENNDDVDDNLSSIRLFVRQAINSCRENLTLVNHLLENIPSSNCILKRKIHRTNCIINLPNTIKGLQYYPSTSVQTE